MALVVADAGPMIALAQIRRLNILQQLFGEIVLPEAVWSESQQKNAPDAELIAEAVKEGWVKVTPVFQTRKFPLSLHDGEIEALQLACDNDDVLLIVDDQLARREAARLGLNFMGTVRVLGLAEQKGFISSAVECIKLMQQNGYRVSVKFLES
uniref:DUF3368 domain-containing protein n=1 Tax=uncultured Thiotrichaceae bacterium TaxID=298394 RepID=A0A6S6UKN4_9GAMM|nr:MAG: Unknown protein [uncultured Thiotrichaceae bacterium]